MIDSVSVNATNSISWKHLVRATTIFVHRTVNFEKSFQHPHMKILSEKYSPSLGYKTMHKSDFSFAGRIEKSPSEDRQILSSNNNLNILICPISFFRFIRK